MTSTREAQEIWGFSFFSSGCIGKPDSNPRLCHHYPAQASLSIDLVPALVELVDS